MMENTALASVTEASNAPFIQSLIADWASGSNYHGVTHPSLGNYLELTSGLDTSVVKCDCEPVGGSCNALNCNSLLHSCGCPQSVMHLGDQLEAAGLTWMDYGEEMDGPCDTAKHGDYVPRHVPFLYYDNVQNDAARCAAHVVPYAGFAPDLVSGPASYSLIAPNLVHDMHKPVAGSGETNLANGNAWLSDNVPPILDSAAFTGGGLVVVVWDEDDSTLVDHDQPIGLIVMSPYAHHGGYVATAHADHNALLATIEDGLGLERLGAATSVEPLSDFFAP